MINYSRIFGDKLLKLKKTDYPAIITIIEKYNIPIYQDSLFNIKRNRPAYTHLCWRPKAICDGTKHLVTCSNYHNRQDVGLYEFFSYFLNQDASNNIHKDIIKNRMKNIEEQIKNLNETFKELQDLL